MLRLGIIGCGRVTTMFHLKAIEASGVIELIGISDKNSEQLTQVNKISNVNQACLDFHDLISNPNIEAVAINTPPNLHESMVLESLDAGKHVLCEKPLAQSIEGCLRIREKQQKTGLVVLPAHNYVYSPSLYRIENMLREDAVGKILRINLRFENNLGMYGSKTDFRVNDPKGIIEDIMPHVLSVSQIIAGHVVEVKKITSSCQKYKVCDNFTTTLQTDQGVELNCVASWTKIIPRFSIEVEGSEGKLSTNLAINPYALTISNKNGTSKISERGLGWYLDLIRFKHPSFSEQYRHLENIIKSKGKQRITVDDEIAMLKIMIELSEQLTGRR